MSEMSTETRPVPVFVDFFAGAIGGIAGVIVGHPFDTVKVKLQTMPHPFPGEQAMYIGSLDCAKKVIKREGFFRGLYRGIGPPILSGTPINAVCFFGYGVGKQLFTSETHKTPTLPEYFVAGMISGLACVAVMTPAERVKCLLQVQSEDRLLNKDGTVRKRFTGSFDCTFKIIKEEGIKGMFRGATITAFREIPGSGGYFISYEWSRIQLQKLHLNESQNICISGGIAGIVYWLIALPFDIIKSRIQTNQKDEKILTEFSKLLKRDGLLSMYRGVDAVLVRAFPVNAIIFYAYEITLNLWQKFAAPKSITSHK